MLCYPVASHILLLGSVLELPNDPNVGSLVLDMTSFVEFLKRLVHQEGLDLKQMLAGCSQMEAIARDTVEEARAADISQRPYVLSAQAQVSRMHSYK